MSLKSLSSTSRTSLTRKTFTSFTIAMKWGSTSSPKLSTKARHGPTLRPLLALLSMIPCFWFFTPSYTIAICMRSQRQRLNSISNRMKITVNFLTIFLATTTPLTLYCLSTGPGISSMSSSISLTHSHSSAARLFLVVKILLISTWWKKILIFGVPTVCLMCCTR